ncbi:MAG: hypothetical protein EXR07_17285 [Acetobacteraceae bacterium]|nr:hypothetical protein [Acetobacteraceae bacterium]
MASKTWINVTANWDVPADWTGGQPGAADTALIGNGAVTAFAVTIPTATTQTVASVVINDANAILSMAGTGSLSVAGDLIITAGTVSFAAAATGTISADGSVANAGGTILLRTGTTLKAAAGVTLGASALLTGAGIVTGAVSGSGTINANAGTLDLQGGISGGTAALTWTNAAGSVLKIGETSSVLSAALGGTGTNETLEIVAGKSLTVANQLTLTTGALKLNSASSALTDLAGINTTLAYTGTGIITVGTGDSGLFGTATWTASGGVLDLVGSANQSTKTNAIKLAIATVVGSVLKLDGAATSGAITINNANQTLEIGSTGALTLTAAESFTNGTIRLNAGSSLTDAAGVTVSTSAKLTGAGTVNAVLAGAGTINASGGTLDLLGGVTGALTALTWGDTAGSVLKVDANASVLSVALGGTGTNETLEIAAGRTLTVANQLVFGATGVLKLDSATSRLTDAAGIDTALNYTGVGAFSVGATTGDTKSLFGTATLTASGGVLDLIGAVNLSSGTNALVLGIADVAGSVLKLDGSVSAGTIAISTANQTLELGATGALTLTGAESIANGAIKLNTGAVLTAASGIAVGAGATLTGAGTVNAPLSGSGTVSALGGTLALTGSVASGLALTIGSSAAANLKIGGTATAASAIAIGSVNQTLELTATGNLTIGAAESITNGTIKLAAGAVLTDAAGISVGAGASLTGAGSVNAALSGSGTVNANAGTLDLQGGISGGTAALTWSNVAGSVLKIGETSSVLSVALGGTGTNETLEIATGKSLTVANQLTLTTGVLKLDSAGSALTDLAGINTTLAYTGTGIITTGAGDAGLFGTATWTASGGVLDLVGSVSQSTKTNAIKLAIATVAGSVLKLDGAATSGAITINNANQTLEIGSTGALTLTAAESFTNGTIRLNAGSSLTDASTVTVSTSAKLTGAGTVNAVLAGAGTINASGGTLDLLGGITGVLTALTWTDAAGSVLKVDANASVLSVALGGTGTNETLEIAAGRTLTVANQLVFGGTGVLKLDSATSRLTDAAGINTALNYTGVGAISVGATTGDTKSLFGTATLIASGGVLDLIGAVNRSSGTNALVLGIADVAGSVLKLDGSVSAGTIAISTVNQTLELGATGALTLTGAESIANGVIKLNTGAVLTAASGIAVGAGATLTGAGTVNAPLSGSGTVTALGGTLALTGSVASGLVLSIDSSAAANLKIGGTAIAASAIAIGSANQTLELTGTGNLTINAIESVTNGVIKLAAGAVLTDAAGVVVGAGALLTGAGSVNAALSGSGTVNANAGTLDLKSGITGGAAALTWSNVAGSVLKIGETSSVLSAALGGTTTNETLEIAAGKSLTVANQLTLTTGVLKLNSASSALTDLAGINTTLAYTGTGIITVGTGDSGLFGTATWTASGGVLDLAGSVNQSTKTNAITLAIANVAGSVLKLNGAVTSGAITISTANETLEIGATGALTLTAAESFTNGTIQLDAGSSLTGAAGVTVGTLAKLTGAGTVNAALSGSGTVTALGGTLALTGSVASGLVLSIDSSAAADLRIGGTATAASAIAIGSVNQTLEVAGTGNLTLTSAESITNGAIRLNAGGVLTGAAGVTLGAGARLTGAGTVNAALSGSGTVTALGGTLALTGSVASGLVLSIDSSAAADLRIGGTATAASAIAIGSVNQTLEIAGTGNLTLTSAESIANGVIRLNAGGVLTGSAGVAVGSGATLTGAGTVNAPLSGSGIVIAQGGTLTLTGSVASGLVLSIDSSAVADLRISGTATAASAIAIGSVNQTLELTAAGNLTINAAESITNGVIKLATGAVLTDAAGIAVGAGALLTGAGSVNAALSGSGTVNANAGTLDLASGISGGTAALTWSDVAGSVLKISETSSVLSAALGGTGTNETLEIAAGKSLTVVNQLTLTTGVLKLDSATSRLTDAAGINTALNYTGVGAISVGATAGDTNSLFGTATLTASGGVLDLIGAVNLSSGTNALVLAIADVAGSVLRLDGSASAGTIGISTANQTLELGAAGALTLTAAESIAGGVIKLNSGAVLTGAAGVSVGAGATLTGAGTVNASLSGSGTVIAQGGALALTGSVASGLVLSIDSSAAANLKISGTATAASAIAIGSANQTLEIGATGNLTLTSAESITNGTIKMNAGAVLTGSAGLDVGAGALLTGAGTVNSPLSGTGTVTALGGTLALTGNFSGGPVLTIDSGAAADLKFSGTATIDPVAIASANQTLEIGATGNLTLTAAESITNGTIQLDAGASLTDAATITIGAGAQLTGAGTVNAALAGTGTITAKGGKLELTGALANGPSLVIDSGSASTLKIGAAAAATSIAIGNANQTLELGAAGALTLTAAENIANGTIKLNAGAVLTDAAGMTVGAGATLTGAGTVNAELVAAGIVTADTDKLTLNGAVTGGGTLRIVNLGTLELTGSVAATMVVDFSSGTLEIDDPTNFGATLAGLGLGDVIGFGTLSASGLSYAPGAGGGTLTVNFIGGGSANLTVTGTYAPSIFSVSGGDVQVACFAAGTRILTPAGEVPIETISAGSEVVTLKDQTRVHRRVMWTGYRHVDLRRHPDPARVRPILFMPGSIAGGVPRRTLRVSPDHAMAIDGLLIPARLLINGSTIRRDDACESVTWFHIETEQHSVVLAENAPSETYLDTGNRGMFENAGPVLVLHPDLADAGGQRRREGLSCLPFAADAARVRALWQRLAGRAWQLGFVPPCVHTTGDPAPRIVAGDRTSHLLVSHGNRQVFALPIGTARVRLVSRASAPCDAEPWVEDRRRLGLRVRRIRFRAGGGLVELPLDHPDLAGGWWDVERDGREMWRWTDGDAWLPVMPGATMVEIEAEGLQAYVVAPERLGRIAA